MGEIAKGIRLLCAISILGTGISLSACGAKNIAKYAVDKGMQAIDDKIAQEESEKNSECKQIIEEKAKIYGIDPSNVAVTSGGTYYKVPIATIHTYEDIEAQVGNYRKWLRFTHSEIPVRQYNVVFVDRLNPDIIYGGFSDQDFGYDSEYYWDDEKIIHIFANDIWDNTLVDEKRSNNDPEKFYEVTGIDEPTASDMLSRAISSYHSFKEEIPDKNDYTYAFIPGDTIMHLEKFIIGDEDCPIEAGKYSINLPGFHGIIHITDAMDNTICRMDAYYRNGHTDDMYDYAVLPAEVELKEGYIIYMTNAISTFNKIY